VDSREKGAFRLAHDFDLGAAYADSLYTTLALCRRADSAGAAAGDPPIRATVEPTTKEDVP
jgi:hypothetical protein